MVYIKHWPEYQAAALALLEASPVKVRSYETCLPCGAALLANSVRV